MTVRYTLADLSPEEVATHFADDHGDTCPCCGRVLCDICDPDNMPVDARFCSYTPHCRECETECPDCASAIAREWNEEHR